MSKYLKLSLTMSSRILLVSIICISSVELCLAQPAWFRLNPIPTSYNIYDLQVVDATTIYSVGQYGTICKTTNVGTNWTVLSTDLLADYNSLFFINSLTGYICSNSRTQSLASILKTTNGGIAWQTSAAITGIGLTDIQFISAGTGFACGPPTRIFRTTNSGLTWDSISV